MKSRILSNCHKVLNELGVSRSLSPSTTRIIITNYIKQDLPPKDLLKKMTLITKRLFHRSQKKDIKNYRTGGSVRLKIDQMGMKIAFVNGELE